MRMDSIDRRDTKAYGAFFYQSGLNVFEPSENWEEDNTKNQTKKSKNKIEY